MRALRPEGALAALRVDAEGRVQRIWLMVVGIVLTWAIPAQAQRVALVVGENAYQTVSPLDNPVADANLVAKAFARAGFEVRLGVDLEKTALEAAIEDFAHEAQQAEVAAVYYAGHGFETGGRNWLVPVDAVIRKPADVETATVPFEAVARSLGGAKVKIVALDACRNNPFAARASEGGVVNRGLAEVELDGFVVLYSAAVGQLALDGKTNSPFATSFARWVSEPNVDLRLLAGRIRDDVMATTKGQQRPFVSASLSGQVTALTPAPPGKIVGAATTPQRPAAYFEFVRAVRDDECFQTRDVKCETRNFWLRDDELYTLTDDDNLRAWDGMGKKLIRTVPMPEGYERAAFDSADAAMVTAAGDQPWGGVNTPVHLVPVDGRATRDGVVEHPASDPVLLRGLGQPAMAVFAYTNQCELAVVDLKRFAIGKYFYWEAPIPCARRGKVHWVFEDDASERLVVQVSGGRDPYYKYELLLVPTRAKGGITCRLPGEWADAAFNTFGGFHAVKTASGKVIAFDRQCKEIRSDTLHRAEVKGVYPFGKTQMMSRSFDGVVKVWDAKTGEIQREMSDLPRDASVQRVRGDIGTVLFLNEDQRLYVWNGEPRLGVYVGPSENVCRGDLSTDGNTLYARKCDGTLEIWQRPAR